MSKFDFITDEELRSSLEADNKELDICFEHGAWKSVHVLVGSVIETLLVDSLVSSGYKASGAQDVLKLDLGQLVEICKTRGILTDKTKELSTVVKSYRNLIHPGRLIRLKEQVDGSSATVARALLTMIVQEVSQRKKEQYGYTAEQIITKIEKDESSVSILPHLLRETKAHEIERLLLRLIPDQYAEIKGNPLFDLGDYGTLERLAKCFRIAFDIAGEDTKGRVAKRFVSILKEAEHETVLIYEDEFFLASDLRFVSQDDVLMIKAHLFSRLEEKRTISLLNALSGIQSFISQDEVSRLIDPLLSEIVYGKNTHLKSKSKDFIVGLWQKTGAPIDKKIETRLQDWKKHLGSRNLPEALKLVEEIIEECEPLPF